MSGTVLVLTEDGDTQAMHVARALARRGAETVILDPGWFRGPARLSVVLTPSGTARRLLLTRQRHVDLDRLASVWFRRPDDPAADVAVQPNGFVSDVWDTLDCPAVPASRAVVQRAQRKLYQLSAAGRSGFELPSTLISTDHDELLDFYLAHKGQVVTRVLDRPWAVTERPPLDVVPPLTSADGRPLPMVAQARVPRRMALRVIVTGSWVFAAEIHSPMDARRLRPHVLPEEVTGRCHGLMARLGLSFATIDLTLTPEGRYVFLEVNPAGGFLLIEEATGMPITEALCDLLLPRPDDHR
ncbi:MvdC/MvdD family ATP grasp protein [Sphaerisporangium fuscum]|uniref:MvdC/MvdD family ATP grasp protein n=1 Tax=Sphaerisporangium fuscum TaxID=2835868 RepID=UPI001BDC84E2|nr:ATP-dependent carboxylate-amine ligase [Sphaerisporangium fuscum]